MPGRQSHGRPLLASSGPRSSKKSKSKSRGKALDAFALAQEQVPDTTTKGVRTRGLEPEPTERNQKRHRRDDEEGDDDDDDDGDADMSGGPQKKRPRKDDESFDGLSEGDSDGDAWHIGVDDDDDDSEIDSDDAFGESDDERFAGYAFRGSSSKDVRGKAGDGSDDEDGESLGSDAIDLAQALDQVSDDDEESEGGSGSGSEEEDESSTGPESDDEDDEDPAQREALKALISGFAGEDEDGDEADQSTSQQRAKIDLKDLGLFGVKDPHIKKSLKLMNKEEKTTTRGTSKKLDIPLPRRQQEKLQRSAAYEKTSETLNRWTDTVKHNRRAEHLFFPLAQNKHDAGLDNGELLPLDKKSSGTELEQTIMAIMEESGLGPSKPKENKDASGEDGQQPSISREELKELWNQRRRGRELQSRELARAKRIKKIKSKAYRRVHRKENMRDELAAKEAMIEAGEIDSEEEREFQDRRRAMERMGSKHKESKWAKMGSKARRAVWDDDFRSGLTEMAQMDAELRRRVEGKTKGSDDEDDEDDDGSVESGDEDGGRERLLKDLERAAEEDPTPRSGLMKMKFMQRGEEAMKKANDELVNQIRRELASDAEEDDGEEEEEEVDIGRRQYGMANPNAPKSSKTGGVRGKEEKSSATNILPSKWNRSQLQGAVSGLPEAETEHHSSVSGAAGAWSRAGKKPRKDKRAPDAKVEELDLSNAAVLATKRTKPKQKEADGQAPGNFSEDEEEVHLPMAIKDQELIKRAFAGEDVVGEFVREKAALVEEDEDKEVDNTLPGWGSWVGEGVSSRDKKRHTGRFITKVEGVKKKDRKDFKLERVIVNEKRVRKVNNHSHSPLTLRFGTSWLTSRALSRTTSTSPLNCLTPLSHASNTSVRCDCPWGQSG